MIKIDLEEFLESKKRHVSTRDELNISYHHDYNIALIYAAGELDKWRKEEGLEPQNYLSQLW